MWRDSESIPTTAQEKYGNPKPQLFLQKKPLSGASFFRIEWGLVEKAAVSSKDIQAQSARLKVCK